MGDVMGRACLGCHSCFVAVLDGLAIRFEGKG